MTSSKNLTPFPSHAEIIREIATALGTYKKVESRLKPIVDTSKASSPLTPIDMKDLLSKMMTKPLEQQVLGTHAHVITDIVMEYFRDYSELVVQENADGVTRADVLELLVVNVAPEFLNEILYQLIQHFRLPSTLILSMCCIETSALQAASEWISIEYSEEKTAWLKHAKDVLSVDHSTAGLYTYHLCPNENHAQQSLPTPQTIHRLFPKTVDKPDAQRFLVALLLARLLDYIKRTKVAKDSIPLAISRIQLGETAPIFKRFRDCLKDERRANTIARAQLDRIYDKLDTAVSLDTIKDSGSQNIAIELIHQAQALHAETHSKEYPVADKSHYYHARYYVLSGDLKSAVKAYGLALNQALYTDGPLTERIINEGYRVAAHSSDKVLLKRLRKVANLLVLDGYGSPNPAPYSNDFDHHVGNWEVEHLAASYQSVFKKEFMFPGYSVKDINVEPWFLKGSKQANAKVDLRSPNAKRTSGIGITNKTPQILLSIKSNNYSGFTKLLDKGANVNVTDSHGTTPLIYALNLLNPLFKGKVDTVYFDHLIKLHHSSDILSSYSSLFESTALASAIGTGKFRYVEKILELADEAIKEENNDLSMPVFVNQVCPIQSPLCRLVCFIIGVKNPKLLDGCQKGSVGLFDLSQLYEIANILLAKGASLGQSNNLEHSPFWLAIQHDEVELLKLMLSRDVDAAATVHDYNKARAYTALEFAHLCNAEKCVAILDGRP